jgi:transposase
MKERVTLNKKEQTRLVVLNQIKRGEMTGKEIAQILDLSIRHERRILAAYRKEGAQGLYPPLAPDCDRTRCTMCPIP